MSFESLTPDEMATMAGEGKDLILSLGGLNHEAVANKLMPLMASGGLVVLMCLREQDPAWFDLHLAVMPDKTASLIKKVTPKLVRAKPEPVESQDPDAKQAEILDRLSKTMANQRMVPRDTGENAQVILSDDPEWAGKITYDELKSRAVLDGEPVQDHDVVRVSYWLTRTYWTEWSKDKVRDAIYHVAHNNSFHPLREFLAGLPEWDGVERCEKLLFDYFPCDHGEDRSLVELHKAYGQCFMIAMVARAILPGSKVDTVLTLQGAQGLRKSTGLSLLVPDPTWFGDDELVFSDQKRLKMYFQGKWLIEIADFSSVKKADVDSVKAMITQRADSFVAMFQREETLKGRTCLFVSTANDCAFLLDAGRRWWVATVTSMVQTDKIVEDRNQLFAEALYRYELGEQWHLSAELEAEQKADVKNFAVIDPVVDKIKEWTIAHPSESARLQGWEFEALFSAVRDWNAATGAHDAGGRRDLGFVVPQRFGVHLRSAGWTRKQIGPSTKRLNRWFPPSA